MEMEKNFTLIHYRRRVISAEAVKGFYSVLGAVLLHATVSLQCGSLHQPGSA